jgi:pimeloyl-ACP methyl ester carboxylesterase/acyl carrier protein
MITLGTADAPAGDAPAVTPLCLPSLGSSADARSGSLSLSRSESLSTHPPSLGSSADDWQVLLNTLAELYVSGVEIDWIGFDRGYLRRRVALPTYPFQRQRYWFDSDPHRAATTADAPAALAAGNGRPKQQPASSGAAPATSLPQQIRAARAEQRAALISTYLKRELAGELGVDEAEIDVHATLAEMGLDSLMIMGITSTIKDDFDLQVYPREVYVRPTIAALAQYLADQWDRLGESRAGTHGNGNGNGATRSTDALQRYQPAARPPSSGPPIANTTFILTAPRSGSTLLRVMLAGHPQLFSPPELHLLPFDDMGQRRELLANSYLGEGLTRALMESCDMDAAQAGEQLAAWAQQRLPVDQVYRELVRAVAPRLLIDKSPTYTSRPEILQRAETWFDQPKYVFLVRHPLAVIESLVRMRMDKLLGQSVDDPYGWAEQVWRNANRNVRDFLQTVPDERCLVLRYETLVTSPSAEMERVAAFLEVPYDDALLEPYAQGRMTDAATGRAAPIDDPNFLTRRRIDPALAEAWRNVRLPRPLTADTRRLARHLGYEIDDRSPAHAVHSPANQVSEVASTAPSAARRPGANGGRSQNGGSSSESFIQANGLQLCVCSWGPADGPVVLCLHGILDQGICWQPVAHDLIQRGYRIVAPDFRGHGRSAHVGAGCAYHFPDFVSDADAVLRTLGNEPVALAGHSLGAVVAAHLALARPERFTSLTLIEPPLRPESTPREQRPLTAYLDYAATPPRHQPVPDLQSAARRLQRAVPALSDRLARKLARRCTESTAGGLVWRWDARLRTRSGLAYAAHEFTQSAFCDLLADLPIPVTVVQGTQGMTRLADDTATGYTCVTIRGGHHLPIEAPEQIAAAIAETAAGQPSQRVILDRCPS